MLSKKLKKDADKISQEALHILKISGLGKDSKETYERAKATLDMIEISLRMLISEIKETKAIQK